MDNARMIEPPDGPPISEALFVQKCAKFTINELRGLMKKHKITFKDFARLIPTDTVVFLVYAICQGRISVSQARVFLSEELGKALQAQSKGEQDE